MNEAAAKARIEELTDVSRETIARLEAYADLLDRWNPKINLVSKSTLKEKWVRHFLDSAQIWPHIPADARILTDIGSGAGFAGLVLAVIAAEKSPDMKVYLVESDARKCAFMRNVARELGIAPEIHTSRIEQVEIQRADVLTARALASLDQLLQFSAHILCENGLCLFLKGQGCDSEVIDARESWDFEAELIKSETHDHGVIAKLTGIKARGE